MNRQKSIAGNFRCQYCKKGGLKWVFKNTWQLQDRTGKTPRHVAFCQIK